MIGSAFVNRAYLSGQGWSLPFKFCKQNRPKNPEYIAKLINTEAQTILVE